MDVSQGNNIIEHDISTAIFSKSHDSAAVRQLFLCLYLKKCQQLLPDVSSYDVTRYLLEFWYWPTD